MADLFILALTVFTFRNNTKIAINIHLLEIFALFLVFSYQFTAKCLSLPPPLLGGGSDKHLAVVSKPLTLPFALAFRTSNIETVLCQYDISEESHLLHVFPRGFQLLTIHKIIGFCSSIIQLSNVTIQSSKVVKLYYSSSIKP